MPGSKTMRRWEDDPYSIAEDIARQSLSYGRHMVVMQFSGLRDRTGREIYEGDVVVGNAKDNFVVVGQFGGLVIHSVRYWGQEHNELISMPTNDAQTADWLKNSLVIGNIYELPELVKV